MSENKNKLSSEDLLALNSLFEESLLVDDPDGFAPMPDGEYMCQVLDLRLTRTKESQKLMVTWEFKVDENEEGAGRYIWKNSILEDNPQNMKRLTNDMAKFGIIVTSLEELVAELSSVVDEYCLVQLKTDTKGRQWQTIDVPEV